jgi:putative ABC transport system permease protein
MTISPHIASRLVKLWNSVAIASAALRTSAFRSMLTMLGIAIGIFSVTLAVAVGAGAQMAVMQSINALGANLAVLYPQPDTGGVRRAVGRGRLTARDARAIRREIAGVEAIAPQLRTDVRATTSETFAATSAIGTEPGYTAVTNRSIDQGRFIDEGDARRAARVAVLGPTVARKLFGDGMAIGERIHLNRIPFTVIGVLAPTGVGLGADNDDLVIVPIATERQRLVGNSASGPDDLDSLFVGVGKDVPLSTARSDIIQLMRTRYHLRSTDVSPFTVRTTEEFMKESAAITGVFQIALAAIASISLLVGGIGIMNMMIVSVVERTREIGLRMAVGARRRDILEQFLAEAAVLCVVGGAAGLALAKLIAVTIEWFAQFPIPISMTTALGAVAFSACIGLVFGAYPAVRASRLSPIVALRTE